MNLSLSDIEEWIKTHPYSKLMSEIQIKIEAQKYKCFYLEFVQPKILNQ